MYFFVCLLLLRKIILLLIHFVCKLIVHFFLTTKYYSIVCMYNNLYIHSPADGCLFFVFLSITNKGAMNLLVQVSVWIYAFTYLRWILRSGLVVSCDRSILNFWRNCQPVFQCGCTNLHPRQQCIRIPLTWHPCQSWVCSVFLILDILVTV